MKSVRIVIFAKAPLPGLSKTRLIPALGVQGAAELARRMLIHTVAQALAADVGPVELCVTPSPMESVWQSIALPAAIAWSDQGDGDLGKRMARTAKRITDAGESILLIGTDCPALDAATLRNAVECLQDVDATLTPAFDGGYVLLGLSRFHASLFDGIAWSTDAVAFETSHRLEQLGWKAQHNPPLHDIDEPVDLRWLPPAWLEYFPDIPKSLKTA